MNLTDYTYLLNKPDAINERYAGTDLKFNGKDYLIMREDDILAII